MKTFTNDQRIDDDETRRRAGSILERQAEAERDARARFERPLDFSGKAGRSA